MRALNGLHLLSLLLAIGLSASTVMDLVMARRFKPNDSFYDTSLLSRELGLDRYKWLPEGSRRQKMKWTEDDRPSRRDDPEPDTDEDAEDSIPKEKIKKRKKKTKKIKAVNAYRRSPPMEMLADERKESSEVVSNPEIKKALMEYLKMSYGATDVTDQVSADNPPVYQYETQPQTTGPTLESKGDDEEKEGETEEETRTMEEPRATEEVTESYEKVEKTEPSSSAGQKGKTFVAEPEFMVRLPVDLTARED